MNYEIQFKLNRGGRWVFWSVADPKIKRRKAHISIIRENFPDRKFRIVRVTRKVVEG